MARIIADVILSAAGIELGEVAVIKAAKAIFLQGFFPDEGLFITLQTERGGVTPCFLLLYATEDI